MHCKVHTGRIAENTCSKCGEWICEECRVDISGRNVCKSCVEKQLFSPVTSTPVKAKERRMISGFWVFVFSMVPGAGHMYMGYMKLGLAFMTAFFGNIFLVDGVSHRFAFLFPVIWFYSFFDANTLKKQIRAGETVVDKPTQHFDFLVKYRVWMAVAAISIGVLELMQRFEYAISRIPWVRRIFSGGGSLFIPLVLILGGIWLVRKSKNATDAADVVDMTPSKREN